MIRGRQGREHAVRESEDLHDEIVENADDMIYAHDVEGRFVFTNEACERLTGYSRAELMEVNSASVFAPEYAQMMRDLVAKFPQEPSSVLREVQVVTKGGTRLPVEVSMRPVYNPGGLLRIQGIVREISQRGNLDQRLEQLASRDYLTGLMNRHRFEEELQVQLAQARRYGTPGALLLLDLDHFRDINDTCGHSVGDEVLLSVSRLLRERLPETDAIARLGSDEFTILAPRTGIDDAQRIAEQILTWLRSSSFVIGDHRLTLSASIGITRVAPDGIATAEELLSRADVALYEAKGRGRNCVFVYSPDTDWRAHIESGLAWRKLISEALDRSMLILFAQPILDLHSDRISQYEMLVRIPDEAGRIIDAGVFIQSAERFGFVPAIDRWTVCRTIELLGEYAALGHQFALQVNLSGASLTDGELLPMIRNELIAKSVDPRNLVVEVTESAAIADVYRAQQFVSGLKQLGCRFALDDFGVGFSSFYQLKHLDVDYLKIDGSFIRSLPGDVVDQHLVKAIVDVARALGQETIAEYVADDETIRLLRELGVDYAQGYHIGQPREAREVLNGAVREASRAA
jgi:diguanylate cyclase (GGDEF)-like protein/PAS domain S-box-containing protein